MPPRRQIDKILFFSVFRVTKWYSLLLLFKLCVITLLVIRYCKHARSVFGADLNTIKKIFLFFSLEAARVTQFRGEKKLPG